MGSNEGHAWVALGGVGHVELSEGFFGLTVFITKSSPFSFACSYVLLWVYPLDEHKYLHLFG